jgi:hypothetical protein
MAASISDEMARNLTDAALPAVNSGAALAGGVGGSRQAIAQGDAIAQSQQAQADALNQLYYQSYGQGLDAQASALGQIGMMGDAAQRGSQTRLGVGALEEDRWQQEIDSDRERFEYYRDYPAMMAALYSSLFNSSTVPFGQYTTATSKSSSYSSSNQESSGGGSGLLGLFG